MENVQVFVLYIIGKTLGILLLLNCHFRNAAATCEKEEKSIWKVNVLKFVATNKCNLDIKSSPLHFPQFCYCFSFLALLDFKKTFIWIILYLSFQRVLRVYNFYRKEGKVVSISACPPPRVTGRRLWCQYCWCLIRSEDGGRVASGGSGVDTTAVPDSTGKWQSGN